MIENTAFKTAEANRKLFAVAPMMDWDDKSMKSMF
jgi:hypothetical protein